MGLLRPSTNLARPAAPVIGGRTTYGLYAAAPSANDGDVHVCSDCPVTRIRSGGAWLDQWDSPNGRIPIQNGVDASAFTASGGTVTATQKGPGVVLSQGNAATAAWYAYNAALPGATFTWDVLCARLTFDNTQYSLAPAIYFADSVSGRRYLVGLQSRPDTGLITQSYNGTTYNADAITPYVLASNGGSIVHFQLVAGATDFTLYMGCDGYNPIQIYTEAYATWLTNGIDGVGFVSSPATSDYDVVAAYYDSAFS